MFFNNNIYGDKIIIETLSEKINIHAAKISVITNGSIDDFKRAVHNIEYYLELNIIKLTVPDKKLLPSDK